MQNFGQETFWEVSYKSYISINTTERQRKLGLRSVDNSENFPGV
jgi:hypothetical protein